MRKRIRIGLLAGLAALAISRVNTSTLWGAWRTEPRQSLMTAAGRFEIQEIGLSGYRLMLNGHLIRELEGFNVEAIETLPPGPAPRFVLLRIDKGAGKGSCPALYRVFDLAGGASPHVTSEFGNCSDRPILALREDHVEIKFPASLTAPARTWTYDVSRRRFIYSSRL